MSIGNRTEDLPACSAVPQYESKLNFVSNGVTVSCRSSLSACEEWICILYSECRIARKC
jgi:hypothetical protein